MPFGAELQRDGKTRFRVWAPAQAFVHVELDGEPAAPQHREIWREGEIAPTGRHGPWSVRWAVRSARAQLGADDAR
jgi:1,4-alpha-glucan branching enzyme